MVPAGSQYFWSGTHMVHNILNLASFLSHNIPNQVFFLNKKCCAGFFVTIFLEQGSNKLQFKELFLLGTLPHSSTILKILFYIKKNNVFFSEKYFFAAVYQTICYMNVMIYIAFIRKQYQYYRIYLVIIAAMCIWNHTFLWPTINEPNRRRFFY